MSRAENPANCTNNVKSARFKSTHGPIDLTVPSSLRASSQTSRRAGSIRARIYTLGGDALGAVLLFGAFYLGIVMVGVLQ
jgi:hypothetical protein